MEKVSSSHSLSTTTSILCTILVKSDFLHFQIVNQQYISISWTKELGLLTNKRTNTHFREKHLWWVIIAFLWKKTKVWKYSFIHVYIKGRSYYYSNCLEMTKSPFQFSLWVNFSYRFKFLVQQTRLIALSCVLIALNNFFIPPKRTNKIHLIWSHKSTDAKSKSDSVKKNHNIKKR